MFLIYQEHICNGGVGGVHVILCFISPLPKSTPEQIYSPTPDALSQPSADCPASPDLTGPHYFWVLFIVGKLVAKSSDIISLTTFLVEWP